MPSLLSVFSFVEETKISLPSMHSVVVIAIMRESRSLHTSTFPPTIAHPNGCSFHQQPPDPLTLGQSASLYDQQQPFGANEFQWPMGLASHADWPGMGNLPPRVSHRSCFNYYDNIMTNSIMLGKRLLST